MLRRGQLDINPHLLPRDFKTNRAAMVTQQQRYNSTRASTSALCDSHGASVFIYVCSVQGIFSRGTFIHALNHDNICLFPRTPLTSNTRRRTSSYHTAVRQVRYRAPNTRQESWSRLDFYLRMGAFYTNFSPTTATFRNNCESYNLPKFLFSCTVQPAFLTARFLSRCYVLYTACCKYSE